LNGQYIIRQLFPLTLQPGQRHLHFLFPSPCPAADQGAEGSRGRGYSGHLRRGHSAAGLQVPQGCGGQGDLRAGDQYPQCRAGYPETDPCRTQL